MAMFFGHRSYCVRRGNAIYLYESVLSVQKLTDANISGCTVMSVM